MSIRAIGSQQCVTQRLSVGMSDLLKIQTRDVHKYSTCVCVCK